MDEDDQRAMTLRLSPAQDEWLRLQAYQQRRPKTEIIREAIDRLMGAYPPVDKPVDNNVMASAIEVPDAS